jgi:hypothetical protein
MTPSELAGLMLEYDSLYSADTELLDVATNTYNCHSYAWNMVEGGPVCWLEFNWNQNNYWHDGSYVATDMENDADKIYYAAYHYGDHSAVKSLTHPGKYESKWGSGPLVRHDPGYGPEEYYIGAPNYYRKCTTNSLTNTMVTTNTSIKGCDITIQNVTVQPNVKLTVDGLDVTINGPFEVKSGAELEIK